MDPDPILDREAIAGHADSSLLDSLTGFLGASADYAIHGTGAIPGRDLEDAHDAAVLATLRAVLAIANRARYRFE